MRLRTFGLGAVASMAVVAAFAGCSGSSGGGSASPTPTSNPTPTTPPGAITEVEPNDDTTIAQKIPTGAQSFLGHCADENDLDFYEIDGVLSGTVTGQLDWNEGTALDDLDLLVYDTNGNLDLNDEIVPPGDSPAEVSGLTTSGTIFVEIDCYNTTPNVQYLGQINSP